MEFNTLFYVYTVVCIIAVIPLFRNWIKNEHSFSNVFNIVYITYIITASIQFYLSNGHENLSTYYRISGMIYLTTLCIIIVSAISVFYLLYISGWNRWHIINIAFIVIVVEQLYTSQTFLYLWCYLIVSSLSSFFFAFKGITYKNGTHVSFGIAWIIEYISFILIHIRDGSDTLYIISKVMQICIISLGTLGILDRYVLYDAKKKNETNNSWIGGILDNAVETKQEKIIYVHSKTLTIECPLCHEKITKHVPAEKIIERKKNPHGLAEIYVYSNHTQCNHDFRVFIDKEYNVLGFETNVQH